MMSVRQWKHNMQPCVRIRTYEHATIHLFCSYLYLLGGARDGADCSDLCRPLPIDLSSPRDHPSSRYSVPNVALCLRCQLRMVWTNSPYEDSVLIFDEPVHATCFIIRSMKYNCDLSHGCVERLHLTECRNILSLLSYPAVVTPQNQDSTRLSGSTSLFEISA